MAVELKELDQVEVKEYVQFLYDLYKNQTCEACKHNDQALVSEHSKSALDGLLPDKELTDNNLFLGIYSKKACVGKIWLALGEEFEESVGFLRYIHIDQQYQNQGIAKEAMAEFEQMCRKSLGLKRLLLNVYGFNKKAIRLYEECGFSNLKINMEKRL